MHNHTHVVNLKKAYELQQELASIFDSINVNNIVAINEFNDAEQAVDDAVELLLYKIERKSTINNARYIIRKLIDDKNYASGLTEKLTHIAYLNKNITFLESIIKSIPETYDSMEVIKSRQEKFTKSEDSYGDNVIRVCILKGDHAVDVIDVLAEYKRTRRSYKDSVAAINLTETVSLPENVMDILKEEKLI